MRGFRLRSKVKNKRKMRERFLSSSRTGLQINIIFAISLVNFLKKSNKEKRPIISGALAAFFSPYILGSSLGNLMIYNEI